VLDPTAPGAAELARLIAARERSALDAVDDCLRRLEGAHERTNCIAAFDHDRARREAKRLDDVLASGGGPVGPLHGVPFTVKDWIDAEGLPSTGGWVANAPRMPRADATVVARMKHAGAVLVAKTTVQPETELFGRVANPYDVARSPGGSSSGEAAAVAAGASPVGLGSDSGGSIRLPAAWCGAIGYKPTVGRVPNTGHFPRVADREDGRTVIGPLARRVEDISVALRVIVGADGLDTAAAPVPFEHEAFDARSATVAVAARDRRWRATDEIERAVGDAVARFERLGARVTTVEMHLDEAFDITRRYWDRASLTGADASRQLDDWDRYRYRMARDTAGVDVIVMPAVREPAPLHRDMTRDDYIFTVAGSLLGWPAIVVPVASVDGLPVCVQLAAKPWDDARLLEAAALVE
jgi:amidase